MLKSLFRRAIAALGLSLFVVAGSTAATARSAAKPALWAVSDRDTTVYLFGTIHLLPDNYQWRTPKFDQVVAGSQQLVVETIVDEKNPHAMMAALSALAFSPNQPPIAERVPPQKRAALEAAIKKTDLPRPFFDRMETWAAAFMLLGDQFKDLGLKMGAGVESTLRHAFASQGKSVAELESNREQLGFFDALPEAAQRALLEGAIEEPRNMSRDFDNMVGAWARGDVEAIAQTFNRDLAASPELREVLLKRRNENWSKWVRQRMAAPGSVMVAVGAGHLAGHDSVLEMLRKSGLKVRRVQ